MESKKRRLLSEIDGDCGSPAEVAQLIAPFSPSEAAELLADICCQVPEALRLLRARADASVAHRKVFVRGLAWSTQAADLQALLSRHGPILETSISKDKATGMSKGFAFVVFATAAAALAAVEEGSYALDGRTVYATIACLKTADAASGGRAGPPPTAGGVVGAVWPGVVPGGPLYGAGPIGAETSNSLDARKVFLRGLPLTYGEEAVRAVFAPFGPIERAELLTEKDTGKFKGSAFITFQSGASAAAVLRVAEFPLEGRVVHAHPATDRHGQSAAFVGAQFAATSPQYVHPSPHGPPTAGLTSAHQAAYGAPVGAVQPAYGFGGYSAPPSTQYSQGGQQRGR